MEQFRPNFCEVSCCANCKFVRLFIYIPTAYGCSYNQKYSNSESWLKENEVKPQNKCNNWIKDLSE